MAYFYRCRWNKFEVLLSHLKGIVCDMEKVCCNCHKTYKPSSGHKICPSCREEQAKVPCEKCGKLRQKDSIQCSACWCKEQAMEKNGNWKGGRRKHSGYIMIRVPDHPRGKNNNGYVFEHIVVMESIIGRYLFPNENVHHKNGIKDDNRSSNLELWVRSQPSGTRVVDLVDWAKEILHKYEDLFLI